MTSPVGFSSFFFTWKTGDYSVSTVKNVRDVGKACINGTPLCQYLIFSFWVLAHSLDQVKKPREVSLCLQPSNGLFPSPGYSKQVASPRVFCPSHLHSQLFSDLKLSAYNPAKQVGMAPASSLLYMRNLIMFDSLLTVEGDKTMNWIKSSLFRFY